MQGSNSGVEQKRQPPMAKTAVRKDKQTRLE